jgi:hypothetical protein
MMNTSATPMEIPSKTKILQATVIAMAIAMVLLFTAVLPAEYGIDPTGTGAALGLTGLAASGAESAPAAAGIPAAGPVIEAPTIKGTFISQPARYKIDSREIKLESGDGVEIKYHMEKGAGMVYSWTATPKELIFYEFHAEPDVKPAGAPEDYYESYEKDDQVGKSESHGTFIAPDTGIHGWFWENQTGVPVTIKLVTAGFYDYIMDYTGGTKKTVMPADPK